MQDKGKGVDDVVSKMKQNALRGASHSSPPPPLVTSSSSIGVSQQQRSAAAIATETNEALIRAIRMNEMTNQFGDSALESLGKQGETIQRSLTNVEETAMNLRDSKRALRDMRVQMWKELLGKALIIGTLLMIIVLIVYVKWVRRMK